MRKISFSTKLALMILLGMGSLAYAAAWNDSMIVDEDPHIASGVGYVLKQDMRLNPEHPPIVKYLAALPVTLIPNLNVPFEHDYWVNPNRDPELVNGQWKWGQDFIFSSGNDADLIVRLARLGPMLLMLLLGWFVYRWTKDRAGSGAALVALLLYATSPTILGHGILVTTDVPAALGIFVGAYYFIRYLRDPSKKTLLQAGIVFGLAQLLKFSVVLLIPYFGLLAFGWWWLRAVSARGDSVRSVEAARRPRRPFWTYVGGTVLIGLIGVVVIYIVYAAVAIPGYPAEQQIADAKVLVLKFPLQGQPAGNVVIEMMRVSILRPIAQYLLGLAMVLQRAVGGNTTYFMGLTARDAWLAYFPIVYLTKIRLAVHLLTLMAIASGVFALRREITKGAGTFIKRISAFALKHFDELAMILFIFIYWATTLTSNLNIGIRHLAPTLPFLFVLLGIAIRRLIRIDPRTKIRGMMRSASLSGQRAMVITGLMLWAVIAGLLAYPHYISSYNVLAALRGGGQNIAVDSNLDWGQDLRRLGDFVEERGIKSITISYFGWAVPEYYMPEGTQVSEWWVDWDGEPTGWFAISTSYKQQGCAIPVRGFGERPGDNYDGYCFLRDHEPEAIVGTSIYVYNLP